MCKATLPTKSELHRWALNFQLIWLIWYFSMKLIIFQIYKHLYPRPWQNSPPLLCYALYNSETADPVPVDPCATVRCANGYQCEVFKPTGEAYCQPNCSLNNGGCPADQECRLQPVICVRAPCPPVIECVERTTACPPTCSKEFCSKKGNRRAMCSRWVLDTHVEQRFIATCVYYECLFNLS